jgi:hypothetical protein
MSEEASSPLETLTPREPFHLGLFEDILLRAVIEEDAGKKDEKPVRLSGPLGRLRRFVRQAERATEKDPSARLEMVRTLEELLGDFGFGPDFSVKPLISPEGGMDIKSAAIEFARTCVKKVLDPIKEEGNSFLLSREDFKDFLSSDNWTLRDAQKAFKDFRRHRAKFLEKAILAIRVNGGKSAAVAALREMNDLTGLGLLFSSFESDKGRQPIDFASIGAGEMRKVLGERGELFDSIPAEKKDGLANRLGRLVNEEEEILAGMFGGPGASIGMVDSIGSDVFTMENIAKLRMIRFERKQLIAQARVEIARMSMEESVRSLKNFWEGNDDGRRYTPKSVYEDALRVASGALEFLVAKAEGSEFVKQLRTMSEKVQSLGVSLSGAGRIDARLSPKEALDISLKNVKAEMGLFLDRLNARLTVGRIYATAGLGEWLIRSLATVYYATTGTAWPIFSFGLGRMSSGDLRQKVEKSLEALSRVLKNASLSKESRIEECVTETLEKRLKKLEEMLREKPNSLAESESKGPQRSQDDGDQESMIGL